MPSKTAFVFLLLFFGGCVAALFRNPFYGILLYEIEYFLNPAVRWWYGDLPNIRYAFILVAIIAASYLTKISLYSENRFNAVPQFRWLLVMTIVVVMTYFWAINQGIHQKLTIEYLKFIFFAALVYKIVDSPGKMESVFLAYSLGIFYISWVGWQMGRTGSGRLEGIGGPDCLEVNGTAAVIATAVPLLLFFIIFGRKRWIQWVSLIALPFVLNCLVLLNSRGAFLALVVSIVFFYSFILREKGDLKTKLKVVGGLIGGCVLFVYLADEIFWSRMESLRNPDPETGSGGRVRLWLMTLNMLADHPFGLGGMGYQLLSPYYLPGDWLSGGQRAVHSLWFEVLSEYGYHGFIVFLGYILSNFFLIRKVRRYLREIDDQYHLLQSVALEAAFIAFLVASTFINRFYSEMLYWLPAFIAAFANIYMIKPQSLTSVNGH